MSAATPNPSRPPIRGPRLAAAGGMVGLLSTLTGDLIGLVDMPANIQMTVATLASMLVGALVISLAGWGRDQVAAGNASILARVASMIGCVLLAVVVAGCVTHDRNVVDSLATKWGGASTFDPVECDDMRTAADALVAGPNKDVWLLGGGGERKTQSAALDRVSVRCDRSQQLDSSAPQASEARSLFNQAWAAAAAAVK